MFDPADDEDLPMHWRAGNDRPYKSRPTGSMRPVVPLAVDILGGLVILALLGATIAMAVIIAVKVLM